MSAQRFTVDRIEAARDAITKLRDSARTGVVIEFKQRDPLVLELHRALDAFALQTQRVEQMREWLEKKAAVSMSTGNDTVNLLLASSETAMYGALQEFSCLFPKNGGQ